MSVARQHAAIAELTAFSQDMYTKMHGLDARVAQLERDNAHFKAVGNVAAAPQLQAPEAAGNDSSAPDGDGRSPPQVQKLVKTSGKRSVANAFDAEGVTMPGRTKYRKKLEVKIPRKGNSGPSGLGLPTPMTSVSVYLQCFFVF